MQRHPGGRLVRTHPLCVGPAAVPADSAGDQGVRAAVQGSDGGGARERALEDLLGSRRRECDGGAAVSWFRGGGPGGAVGVRNVVGAGATLGRDAGPDAAGPHRQSTARGPVSRSWLRQRIRLRLPVGLFGFSLFRVDYSSSAGAQSSTRPTSCVMTHTGSLLGKRAASLFRAASASSW